MTRRRSTLLGLALASVVAATPATGQDAEPAFTNDLLRFSEILGALAYLDTLCGQTESGVWRRQMQALLDAQELSPEDRRKYVDVYNRGHRTFATVHRVCTGETRAILSDYLGQGAEVAERLELRFGRGSG